jgi:hypothetical protein
VYFYENVLAHKIEMARLAPAQQSLAHIIQAIIHIDRDQTLSAGTVDASLIYEIAFDGGGEVSFHYRGNALVKVRQELGPSWGRSTYAYYFLSSTLMLFREREELFPFIADGIGQTRLEASYNGRHDLLRMELCHYAILLSPWQSDALKDWTPRSMR